MASILIIDDQPEAPQKHTGALRSRGDSSGARLKY